MKEDLVFFNTMVWLGLIYIEVSSHWLKKLMGGTIAFIGAVGIIAILIEGLFP